MNAWYKKYELIFKRPILTSRGEYKTRPVWFLFLNENGKTGVGECAPLSGISPETPEQVEKTLTEICKNPKYFIENWSFTENISSVRFALETAWLDLLNGGNQLLFPSAFSEGKKGIPINGLIWMGEENFMKHQIQEKLNVGFRCIKLKIGGIDFEKEIELLKSIRKNFDSEKITIRVDANGAFHINDALEKLQQLAEFKIHSIEQPIAVNRWAEMAKICRESPIPVALDEELIGISSLGEKEKLLDTVSPQFLVLKPSLHGGFSGCDEWIKLAEQRNIGWWVTSYLESNIGLNAIAQWTFHKNAQGFQGLGTGGLFSNNFNSQLEIIGEKLWFNPQKSDSNEFLKEWYSPKSYIEVSTSGSTGKPKTIRLEKQFVATSAQRTLRFFQLKEGDRVLHCLPEKYIAGKLMVVRALLGKLDLFVAEPNTDFSFLKTEKFRFAAMVPVQVNKILKAEPSPGAWFQNIEQLLIGGSAIPFEIEKQLTYISTACYSSYAMTETATHIALRKINGPDASDFYVCLENIHVQLSENGCLQIFMPELPEQPLLTTDLAELKDEKTFRILGRSDNVIISGGIKHSPEQIEKKLEPFIEIPFLISSLPHCSLGEQLVLILEGNEDDTLRQKIKTICEQQLSKYEQPRQIIFIQGFKYNENHKIDRKNW